MDDNFWDDIKRRDERRLELEREVEELRQRLQQTMDIARIHDQAMIDEAVAAATAQIRSDSALVVHALNCAMQLIDGLISWVPHGQVLPPTLTGLHERFVLAMETISRREGK